MFAGEVWRRRLGRRSGWLEMAWLFGIGYWLLCSWSCLLFIVFSIKIWWKSALLTKGLCLHMYVPSL